MANKDVVRQLLTQYLQKDAGTVAEYILDSVNAELGAHTDVTREDVARTVAKVLGKVKKPTAGFAFEEI